MESPLTVLSLMESPLTVLSLNESSLTEIVSVPAMYESWASLYNEFPAYSVETGNAAIGSIISIVVNIKHIMEAILLFIQNSFSGKEFQHHFDPDIFL